MNISTAFKRFTKLSLSLVILLSVIFSGCASFGQEFPVTDVALIQVGKTTQKEIRQTFGSPWRTGLESGQKTWTYGKYRYVIFMDKNAKDLVIRFDDKNVVASYTFSTTDHAE